MQETTLTAIPLTGRKSKLFQKGWVWREPNVLSTSLTSYRWFVSTSSRPLFILQASLIQYYTAIDRNDGCYYGKLCKLHLTFLNMSLWKNSILMSPQIGIGWLGSNINPLSHFLPFEPNIGRWMIMKMTTTLRK